MKLLIVYITCIIPLFAITDVGGNISTNTVWGPTGNPPDTVYNLISDIFVLAGVTLTIQPGVRVQSTNHAVNIVGRLVACGTHTEKITFTGASSSPGPGEWPGIFFEQSSVDSSLLIHCVVEYAFYGIANIMETLHIDSSRFAHCINGICPAGQDVITGCEVTDNVEAGIWYNMQPDTLGPCISGTVISNNPIGIKIWDCATVPRFPQPNYFTNNGVGIDIFPEVHIYDDRVWDPAVGGTDCRFYGDLWIEPAATLTIAPGNTFEFNGGWLNVSGRLVACGTPTEKITFTAANSSPYPGAWQGIVLSSSSETCLFENCHIEYAQQAVQCFNDSVIITNSEIYNSINGIVIVHTNGTIEGCDIAHNQYGIFCQYDFDNKQKACDELLSRKKEKPSRDTIPIYILYNEIRENSTGIHCTAGASPHIMYNEIYDNMEWGVYNEDNNYWIYAEYNWWGDSTGPCDTSGLDTLYNPNGLGDRVSDHVDYAPWIGQDPGIEENTSPLAIKNTAFGQPKPNPFANRIFLTFDLAAEQEVKIRIYNSLGQLVRTLMDGKQSEGSYTVHWDGNDRIGRRLPAGIYWCTFRCEDLTRIEKIILVR